MFKKYIHFETVYGRLKWLFSRLSFRFNFQSNEISVLFYFYLFIYFLNSGAYSSNRSMGQYNQGTGSCRPPTPQHSWWREISTTRGGNFMLNYISSEVSEYPSSMFTLKMKVLDFYPDENMLILTYLTNMLTIILNLQETHDLPFCKIASCIKKL